MVDFSNLQAFFIGALQGVTEFLPISSSAHLILYSYFRGEGALPLAYNVALHFGTAFSLLVYFSQDWFSFFRSIIIKTPEKEDFQNRALFLKLVIASIPAGILGLLFKDFIEDNLHTPSSIIFPLALFGVLLWFVDKNKRELKNLHDLSFHEAFLIGLGQSVALIPGVSRSASSIIAGRLFSLTRKDAVRFSFLMGTPIMVAAGLLHIGDFYRSLDSIQFYIGFFSSFFVGLFSIHFFLKIFVRFGFFAFAVYRVILAFALFAFMK